ncbi:DUF1496 domain-containing protein [Pelagibius sp. Alg239-R121]|uniref:DUF1496 domain-containing protein n=1 Tax=Pelagibius sp. Alg239-R121 TaxID=2993448 RepID=UPI0024A6BDAB|nr:DUF1496 domain-containing protein [Pelagibius sp. Alg239-R121]
MRKFYLAASIIVLPLTAAHADGMSVAGPEETRPLPVVLTADEATRHCVYANETYSEGAVLTLKDAPTLTCSSNPQFGGGPIAPRLKWIAYKEPRFQ